MAGYANIEPSEIYLDSNGGTEWIEVSVDTPIIGNGWEINVTDDMWCEIYISERYSTKTTIKVEAAPNPTDSTRMLDLEVLFSGVQYKDNLQYHH